MWTYDGSRYPRSTLAASFARILFTPQLHQVNLHPHHRHPRGLEVLRLVRVGLDLCDLCGGEEGIMLAQFCEVGLQQGRKVVPRQARDAYIEILAPVVEELVIERSDCESSQASGKGSQRGQGSQRGLALAQHPESRNASAPVTPSTQHHSCKRSSPPSYNHPPPHLVPHPSTSYTALYSREVCSCCGEVLCEVVDQVQHLRLLLLELDHWSLKHLVPCCRR